MDNKKPKALLIGENPQGSSYLAKRLQERGCECEFAVSYQEARSLLMAQGFDLALSPMRLRDGSLFPLIGLLDGSGITLFYFHAVEDGCLWLPALRRGQKCFGSSALRPSEFVSALDEAIDEIRFDRHVAGTAQQPAVRQSVVSISVAPSSRQESLTRGPVCAMTSALVKRKAAG
jgi:CheY-like chemotaxis protein